MYGRIRVLPVRTVNRCGNRSPTRTNYCTCNQLRMIEQIDLSRLCGVQSHILPSLPPAMHVEKNGCH